MNKVKLGQTDVLVSQVSLGCRLMGKVIKPDQALKFLNVHLSEEPMKPLNKSS